MSSEATATTTPVELPELWRTAQVAAYLGVREDTVRGWRADGEGPPPTKVGRQWRYELPALLAWVESGRRGCSHEPSAP